MSVESVLKEYGAVPVGGVQESVGRVVHHEGGRPPTVYLKKDCPYTENQLRKFLGPVEIVRME